MSSLVNGRDETSFCDFAMERMAQVLKANNTVTHIEMVRCLFLLCCAAVVYSLFSRTTFERLQRQTLAL